MAESEASAERHRDLTEKQYVFTLRTKDRDRKRENNFEALHSAATSGDRTLLVKLLRDNGLSTKSKDSNGDTPLIYCCKYGHISLVRYLLDANSSVEETNAYRLSPLHFAAIYGHKDIISLLIKRQALINSLDMDGLTPLHWATSRGKTKIVMELLNDNADPNISDKDGITALHIATIHGKEKLINKLLSFNSQANAQTKNCLNTPLLNACENHQAGAVELLLRKNADPNLCDINGDTPLHIAARHNSGKIIELLLDAGADAQKLNFSGRSPRDETNREEIRTTLRSRKIKISDQDWVLVPKDEKKKTRTVIQAITVEDKDRALEQLATPKQKNSNVVVLDGAFGEVEVGFKSRVLDRISDSSDLVCPVTIVDPDLGHHPLKTISRLAKFLSGKLNPDTPPIPDPYTTPEKHRHKRTKSHDLHDPSPRNVPMRSSVENKPTTPTPTPEKKRPSDPKRSPGDKRTTTRSPDLKQSRDRSPDFLKQSSDRSPDLKQSRDRSPDLKRSTERSPDRRKPSSRSPNNSKNSSPERKPRKKRSSDRHRSADPEIKLGKLLDIDFPANITPLSHAKKPSDVDLLTLEERIRVEKEADTSLDIIYNDHATFEDSPTTLEMPQINLNILQMEDSSDSESSYTVPQMADRNNVQNLLRELSQPSVDIGSDSRPTAGISSSDEDISPPPIYFPEFDDPDAEAQLVHLRQATLDSQPIPYYNMTFEEHTDLDSTHGPGRNGNSVSRKPQHSPCMTRHSTTDLLVPHHHDKTLPHRSVSVSRIKTRTNMDDRLIRLLEELHLEKYIDVFIEEEWDWDSLLEVTNSDLVDMGLKAGSRRKLMSAIQRVREQEGLRASDPGQNYVNFSSEGTSPLRTSQPGTVIRKPYEIDFDELTVTQYLGKGFYGNVFLGKWNSIDVAVKKVSGDVVDIDKWLNEVELLFKLRHPNIVTFYCACIQPPNCCIVLEYFPRGTLENVLLDSAVVIDNKRRLELAIDIARGMVYLHSQVPPVIHRDLKSDNILISVEWRAKVSDFGLSRYKDESYSYTKPTCPFDVTITAVEVLVSNHISEKADVYSFGLLLWELYSRKRAFKGMNPHWVAKSVINDNLRPSLADAANWSVSYVELMVTCWDQDYRKRPSFRDIQTRLENMFTHEVGSAKDVVPSVGYV